MDECRSAARPGQGRDRAPRATPTAPTEIPSPLRPGEALLRLRVCVGWRVSPLSCLMRVKKLTGLFPTMISTALQVSLEEEWPCSHPGASCCYSHQPTCAAMSLSVLSQLPESDQCLFSGCVTKIQAVPWVGKGRGGGIPMDTSPTALVPLPLPPEHLCSIPGRSPGDGRRGLPQRRSLRSASLQLRSLGRSWAREKNPREGIPSSPGTASAGLGKLRQSWWSWRQL